MRATIAVVVVITITSMVIVAVFIGLTVLTSWITMSATRVKVVDTVMDWVGSGLDAVEHCIYPAKSPKGARASIKLPHIPHPLQTPRTHIPTPHPQKTNKRWTSFSIKFNIY